MKRRGKPAPAGPATARLDLFELRPEWQVRGTELDAEHVEQLRGVLEDGGSLPPLSVVVLADGSLALMDGYHRHAAYVAEGVARAPYVVVAKGEEAIPWQLAHANAEHGLSRTAAQKRAAVRRAIEAPEGGDASNVDLARWCGVSRDLVAEVREELRGAKSARAERTERAAAEAAADPTASAREIARRTGVDDHTVSQIRGGGGAENAGRRHSPHPGTAEPQRKSPEPRQEWQERADAHETISNAIARVMRELAPALDLLATHDRQAIHGFLQRAGGAARAGKPVACPAEHENGAPKSCRACGGKGWVTAHQLEAHARLVR